jgi:hypothetical protein
MQAAIHGPVEPCRALLRLGDTPSTSRKLILPIKQFHVA